MAQVLVTSNLFKWPGCPNAPTLEALPGTTTAIGMVVVITPHVFNSIVPFRLFAKEVLNSRHNDLRPVLVRDYI